MNPDSFKPEMKKQELRIITSIARPMQKKHLKAFRSLFSDVSGMDLKWYQSIIKNSIITNRFRQDFIVELVCCLSVICHRLISSSLQLPVSLLSNPVSILFERENETCQVRLGGKSRLFSIDLASLRKIRDSLTIEQSHPSACEHCGKSKVVIKCRHCGGLAFCSVECEESDFKSSNPNHIEQCQIYQNKLKKGKVGPGEL